MDVKKIKNQLLLGHIKISYVFIILFFVNLVFFLLNYGNIMLLSDTSRELYLPSAINNGGILYKDIFNVYSPLGYQLNAFLTAIFSDNIITFYLIGFVNSLSILAGLYFILRFFIKKSSLLIISTLLLIISSCFYCNGHTNYIIPYSYSLVFALNTFIWSLVCTLYFIKKEQNKFLYLAFIFYGASISFKYEFLPFILILISILICKRVKIRNILFSLFCLFFIPMISLGNLLFQGVTIIDLKNAFNYMAILSQQESVKNLYTFLGFYPTFESIKKLIYNFIYITFITSLFTIIAYLPIKILKIYKNQTIRICSIIGVLGLLVFLYLYTLNYFIETNTYNFSWIGVISLFTFCVLIYKEIKNHKKHELQRKDILFYTLFLSTILCSFKCIFNISFNSYGTYYFPLLFICNVVLLYKLYEKKNKTKFYAISIFILLLLSSLYIHSNIIRSDYIFEHTKIETNKGYIAPEKGQAKVIQDTLNYIKEKTKATDTILVLPEGAMLNYLTDRKSNNKYYYLIPPNIETFGEENIVKDLENNLPEYLILQSSSFINFKETYFCESFGLGICNLIPQYYNKPIVFGNDFWLAIYKKK